METGDVFLDSNVQQLLNLIAEENNLENVKIEVKKLQEAGENFFGEVAEVELGGKCGGSLHLIVKKAFSRDAIRANLPLATIYKAEVFFYTSIVPIFARFEISKGVSSPLPFVAKCYRTCLENKKEVLILENLKTKGFSTVNSKVPLGLKEVTLILETYGRLHALSYAFKDQNPEKYKEICQNIDASIIYGFYEKLDVRTHLLEKWKESENFFDPKTELKYIEALKRCQKDVDHFGKCLKGLDNYSVILHADGWVNNILIKYQDSDKKTPIDLRLIDFQMLRIGSPAIELSYFLYTVTEQEIFADYQQCLKIYHDSLKNHLKQLGSSEDLFPYSVLEEHWKKWAKYGFMFAFFILKIMFTEKNEAVSLHNTEIGHIFRNKISNNWSKYVDRITDLIRHFVNNDLLFSYENL